MSNIPISEIRPKHFAWRVEDRVATITLNRPERKNPLTFESYRELPALSETMARRGFARGEIDAVLGGNYARVFAQSMRASLSS